MFTPHAEAAVTVKCKELYLRLGIETRMWPWTELKKTDGGKS